MTYIDGYLTPVHVDKKEVYRAFSAKLAPIYREYGALRVVDCWHDELEDASKFHAEGARDSLRDKDVRDFKTAVGAEAGESVIFSWMEWPDKATRDAGLEKVLADPRVQPKDGEEMTFEGRRVLAGGFAVILDA